MKILLADNDAARAVLFARSWTHDPGVSVVGLNAGEMLADAVTAHRPDVVLVDMVRPDRDALDGLRLLARQAPHPVAMFVDEDDPQFMEEAIAAGICSYNVGSLAPAQVKPILRAAVAIFRQQQETRAALDAAEARLRDREMLDQAKALLMRERRLSEPEAHRWLQRQAMAGGRRLRDVAQALLTDTAPGRNPVTQ